VTGVTATRKDSLKIKCVGVFAMNTDKRELVNVLRKELEFLEKGGYRDSDRVPWRPKFIFQDSPACLNFDPAQPAKPCSDCTLTQLVPENLRDKKIPCRYIPLNDRGETIDSFYRSGTRSELEDAFGCWLRATIHTLQERNQRGRPGGEPVEIHIKAKACLAA
jgi:hypothetical protein